MYYSPEEYIKIHHIAYIRRCDMNYHELVKRYQFAAINLSVNN